MDRKYSESNLIEMIIKEKIEHQELAMNLESVDDKDLIELIRKLNKGIVTD